MVDCPRFARPLVERIEAMGGVATMFLTHRDDIADHAKFRAHFGCERVIHARDAVFAPERRIEGTEPVELAPGATIIPVPGHTAGSCCLLVDGQYLFSGDHAAFDPARGHVYAFRDACWYDWRELARSMRRLAEYDFEFLLPGHGHPCRFEKSEMRVQVRRCLAWMEAA
jgi:glyoxylase-like metal-dependent hydrolase (beta-lactamase superfamily II)